MELYEQIAMGSRRGLPTRRGNLGGTLVRAAQETNTAPESKAVKRPDDPWAKMLSWEEWKYPNSQVFSNLSGGGGSTEKIQVGPTSVVVMLTPDDYEKVLEFYAAKFGAKILTSYSGSGPIGFVGNDQIVGGHVVSDVTRSPDDGGPGRERPVKIKMLARRTSEYDLTLVISKSEGEKMTHIMLAYFPSP